MTALLINTESSDEELNNKIKIQTYLPIERTQQLNMRQSSSGSSQATSSQPNWVPFQSNTDNAATAHNKIGTVINITGTINSLLTRNQRCTCAPGKKLIIGRTSLQ